ncbi:MAG TPA: DUF1501 domain-containing protein [Candidatus Peribacteria bacterium]|nr:DUF1501 domain-containing protein [Candidatus Peribacteria bacterium]
MVRQKTETSAHYQGLPEGSQSRRDFLRLGLMGLGGVSLSMVAKAGRDTRREMAAIGLYLDGAMSQVDFADWKPDAGEDIRGRWQPRDANHGRSGVIFSPYFPRLAGMSEHIAVIRTMTARTLTHDDADANALLNGNRTTLAKRLGEIQPGGVPYVFGDMPVCDTNPIYRAAHQPNEALEIRWNAETNRFAGPPAASTPEAVAELTGRRALLGKLNMGSRVTGREAEKWDARQELAFDIASGNMASFDLDARDLKRYGNNPFGAGLLLARNLAASGRVKSVTLRTPDWDKHSNIHEFMDLHGRQMDQAVAELIADHRRGVWRGLFWARGEFGRTPRLNGSAGRDHWSTHAAMLAGENIQGGVVLGETDATGVPTRTSVRVTDANFQDMALEAMGKPPDFADRVPGLVVRRRAQ